MDQATTKPLNGAPVQLLGMGLYSREVSPDEIDQDPAPPPAALVGALTLFKALAVAGQNDAASAMLAHKGGDLMAEVLRFACAECGLLEDE